MNSYCSAGGELFGDLEHAVDNPGHAFKIDLLGRIFRRVKMLIAEIGSTGGHQSGITELPETPVV